jgi:hypothetical protein
MMGSVSSKTEPSLLFPTLRLKSFQSFLLGCGWVAAIASGAIASPTPSDPDPTPSPSLPVAPPSPPLDPATRLDLDPQLIQSSPVLRRWLKAVPDVMSDIQQDPSFRTRVRFGYAQYPSTAHASGLSVGLRDVFLGRTGFTLNADYHTAFTDDSPQGKLRRRTAWGTDLHYYLRPLGSTVNIAPILGFQHLETSRYTTAGVNVGLKLLLVPSRTGAADLSLSQTWVAPGSAQETGLTTFSVGYALTPHLRLATDIQAQNAPQRKDSRVGIFLEWMF